MDGYRTIKSMDGKLGPWTSILQLTLVNRQSFMNEIDMTPLDRRVDLFGGKCVLCQMGAYGPAVKDHHVDRLWKVVRTDMIVF